MAGESGLEPEIFRSKGERVTNYTTPQFSNYFNIFLKPFPYHLTLRGLAS